MSYRIAYGLLAVCCLCLTGYGVAYAAEPDEQENAAAVDPIAVDEAAERPMSLEFGPAQPFSLNLIVAQAMDLAHSPYMAPEPLEESWASLSFDEHRSIRFRTEYAVPLSPDGALQLQLLPPGRELNNRVRINLVDEGATKQLSYHPTLFSFDEGAPDDLSHDNLDFSGFRLHGGNGVSDEADILDEFVVFQGASYFRGIASGQVYGLSARGLAINVGGEEGEEFPIFREFWIEKSAQPADGISLHALLDAPSATGVYTFKIAARPKTQMAEAHMAETRMDVSAIIFPRTEILNFGLAPLTSMFFFDGTNRQGFDDFRSAVHDSEGLAIHNGAGEWLWRPLANPTGIQESAFVDRNPQGFGLIQRSRRFENYGDLALQYEARPSAWIEPKGDWGRGAVTLIELPTTSETNDNIVAYWRPSAPFLPGERYEFAYRLTWGPDIPITNNLLKVIDTRIGAHHLGHKIVVIDYLATDLPTSKEPGALAALLVPEVNTDRGVVSYPVVEDNPHTGGVRLTFQYDPQDEASTEFRVVLRRDGQTVSEKWLYRWTRQ